MKNLNELPILDFDLITKFTGNKPDLAQDMLVLLLKNLPKDLALINQLFAQKKYQELKQQLHKLHGALCYCGVPRLKVVVAQCETELKNNTLEKLPTDINLLNSEIDLLFQFVADKNFLP